MQPTKLFGSHFFFFTAPIFLPAPVYKDKGKLDYEGAKELSGFAFASVE